MRWNSGISLSSAYQIKTPDAIIRPLGTVLDLLVESQRTMVVLRRGRIDVCSVGAPQRCRTLSEPGEMIIATPSGLEGPKRGGLGQSEFADQCLSADAIPCVITASISPPVRPKRHAQDSRPVREQASVPREQPSRRVRVGCPSFPMSGGGIGNHLWSTAARISGAGILGDRMSNVTSEQTTIQGTECGLRLPVVPHDRGRVQGFVVPHAGPVRPWPHRKYAAFKSPKGRQSTPADPVSIGHRVLTDRILVIWNPSSPHYRRALGASKGERLWRMQVGGAGRSLRWC
jgi:hypothetical protein